VKLIARRYHLDLSLTRKFGYRPSGILRWDVKLSNLGENGRTAGQRSNRNCSANHCAYTADPHAPSFLLCTLADVRPLLTLDQMTGDGIHFPTATLWNFQIF
jgi:hypothetical protein